MRPGDIVEVGFLRNGAQREASVELKKLNNSEYISEVAEADIIDELGFEVRELTTEERLKVKKRGVRVTKVKPGSKIDQTNMVETYIITHINKQTVNSVDDLRRLMKSGSGTIEIEGFYEDVDGDYAYRIEP